MQFLVTKNWLTCYYKIKFINKFEKTLQYLTATGLRQLYYEIIAENVASSNIVGIIYGQWGSVNSCAFSAILENPIFKLQLLHF